MRPLFSIEKFKISRDDIIVGGILGEGFFGEVHNGVYKTQVRFFFEYQNKSADASESDAFAVCVQTGEKLSVAIKTCKNCSADVKEKFLSEAGEHAVTARFISVHIRTQ